MERKEIGAGINKIGSYKIIIPEYPPEKNCPQCGLSYPISEFSKNRTRFDGLQSECKECAKANNYSARMAAKGTSLDDPDK